MKITMLIIDRTKKQFMIYRKFNLKTYLQIEELTMILVNLIKVSTMGGVIFMGLNLLSEPAQAISVKFSFANLNGDAPTGADQLVTGTIDGLVEGDNSGVGVTATVLSTPTGQLLGNYDFLKVEFGSPNAFIVTNGNITFTDADFRFQSNINVPLIFLTAGVFRGWPNGGSQLVDSNSSVNGFYDRTQSATFTATAVPWETDALPVIGSTVLFGLGLWAKNKFAKPLQK
jgi:hypothetical protein